MFPRGRARRLASLFDDSEPLRSNDDLPDFVGFHPIATDMGPTYHAGIMPRPFVKAKVADKLGVPTVVGSVSTISYPHGPVKSEPEAGHLNDHFRPSRAPAGSFPWSLVLGLLSTVLLIAVGLLWSRLGDRNASLRTAENRAERLAARALVTGAQLAEAQPVTLRLLRQLDETKAENERLKATGDQTKIVTARLQAELAAASSIAIDLNRENEKLTLAAPALPSATEAARAAEIERRRTLLKGN